MLLGRGWVPVRRNGSHTHAGNQETTGEAVAASHRTKPARLLHAGLSPRAGVTEKGMLELTRPERRTQPSVHQRVARRLAHGGGAEPQTTWLSLQGAVRSDKGSPEGHTLGLFVCCWNERADGGHGLGRRWEEGGCGRKRATQGTLVVTGVLSPSLWQMCGPTRVTTLVHAHTHRLESDCGVCLGHCIVFGKMSPREAGSRVLRISALSLTPAHEPAVPQPVSWKARRRACRAKPRCCPSSHTGAQPCVFPDLPPLAVRGAGARVAECGRGPCGACGSASLGQGLGLRRLEFEGGREGEAEQRENVLRLQTILARTCRALCR